MTTNPVTHDSITSATAADKAEQKEQDKEIAAAAKAAEDQATKDKAAAKAAEAKAKAKAAHIVSIEGGKPAKGMANSTGNDGVVIPRDGVVIPRDGVLTIALIGTSSPTPGLHPGNDANCVARLPDKSEVGDLVEAYCIPGLNGGSAYVHPPKWESIGNLPVSTGDNGGTGVEVPPDKGRRFRKISAAAWQVLGG